MRELGFLLATWEHRVFVTACLLQINPFDQFGVVAGKKAARKSLKKAKLSIHSIPGFSRITDLDKAIDCGVDIFRIGTNSTEIDTAFSQIEFCNKKKVEVWGVLMMAHLVYNKKTDYLKKIKYLVDQGVTTIVIMDSAGIFLPRDIKEIFTNIKKKI